MPELGTLTGARAASLAGLAPITRESGHWKGRSFIQGGRHRVRRLLYMPALVAVQHNPDLKRKYEALVAKGKPLKVALTAVMRKLLVLANTSGHRKGGVARQVSAPKTRIHLTWILVTVGAARAARTGLCAAAQDATAQADTQEARCESPEGQSVKRPPTSFSHFGAA